MIIQNAKGSGSLPLNESPRSDRLSHKFISLHPQKEGLSCVFLVEYSRGRRSFSSAETWTNCLNADSPSLHCDTIASGKSLIEKCPAIANRNGVILQHDNAGLATWQGRKTLEKINELELGGIASSAILARDSHLFRSLRHFLSGEKIWKLGRCPK